MSSKRKARLAKLRRWLQRPHWLLWHPHQKLWNWSLVEILTTLSRGRRSGRTAIGAIVKVDSLLLYGRARLYARSQDTSAPVAVRPQVIYIDCGLHKHGKELRQAREWLAPYYDLRILGFEASPEHFRDASLALSDLDDVRLHHVALVGPNHNEGEIRLYRAGGEGRADSIFAQRGVEFDVVPARRLSDILADDGYQLDRVPVILRMNIEGAEQGVLEDLLAADLAQHVDGYYGMWDDLSKIDPKADRVMRRLMRRHGISPFTFNDRDLSIPLRREAIRMHMIASIQRALVVLC